MLNQIFATIILVSVLLLQIALVFLEYKYKENSEVKKKSARKAQHKSRVSISVITIILICLNLAWNEYKDQKLAAHQDLNRYKTVQELDSLMELDTKETSTQISLYSDRDKYDTDSSTLSLEFEIFFRKETFSQGECDSIYDRIISQERKELSEKFGEKYSSAAVIIEGISETQFKLFNNQEYSIYKPIHGGRVIADWQIGTCDTIIIDYYNVFQGLDLPAFLRCNIPLVQFELADRSVRTIEQHGFPIRVKDIWISSISYSCLRNSLILSISASTGAIDFIGNIDNYLISRTKDLGIQFKDFFWINDVDSVHISQRIEVNTYKRRFNLFYSHQELSETGESLYYYSIDLQSLSQYY